MGIEILGILVAGAGASWGWWQLQRHRHARLGLKKLESGLDEDAQIVFSVAGHAMTSRGHHEMWPLHLLYGLLQDEAFTAAIKSVGGDVEAIEGKVLTELDEPRSDAPEAVTRDRARAAQLVHALNYAFAVAHSRDTKVSVTDLAARVLGTDVAQLLGVDRYDLYFRIVHGLPEQPLEMPGRTDVAVVLRNDNHTTFEFVLAILQNVFELSPTDAEARAYETHNHGRTVIGRYKLAAARDKVSAARSRAREHSFPLWLGLEDC